MTIYTKKFVLYWLGKWALAGILVGLFLICLLPPVYGWITGNVIGGLFASFLAKHDTLLSVTEQALGLGYTLLAVVGFDFLFLFMTYMTINTLFEHHGTRKEIAAVSLRALRGLLLWQVIIGTLVLVFFGNHLSDYIYSLIPPFLTQNIIASVYMMFWEMFLLLFALGYALMEDMLKGCLAGVMLGFNNFIISFAGMGACILITWIPAWCLGFLHLPTWVLVPVGMVLHVVLFNVLLYMFLQQKELVELFTKE